MTRAIQSSDQLRVALLVKCLGVGGTERQLVELLRGLDRSRVNPRVACLMKFGEFLAPLAELGIEPPEFPLRGTLLRPNTCIQALRMALWLVRERASLLHCQDLYSNILGSMAAPLARVPWIVSRRDMGVLATPAHRLLLAAITRRAPLVLCNSKAIRDTLIHQEGVAPEHIRVIPNGLDLERFDREFALPPETGIPELKATGPVVTLVANLKHSVKGHAEFLDAAAAVVRAVPGVRFLLVGDGELRPQIESQAHRLGIRDAIIFAGYRTDVPALLGRSTLAVSSSTTEGLSNAIMEAMAARLPVVATAVGGTRELVLDTKTGFLVPSGRPDLLASRIVELLQSPGMRSHLGRAGRHRIETEFSARRLSDRVTTLYEELSGRPTGLARAA